MPGLLVLETAGLVCGAGAGSEPEFPPQAVRVRRNAAKIGEFIGFIAGTYPLIIYNVMTIYAMSGPTATDLPEYCVNYPRVLGLRQESLGCAP